jgi:hypothetical protein
MLACVPMPSWWFLVLFLCLQLIKLMEQFPDVVFLKVNFDDNKAMCKTLGVKVCYCFLCYCLLLIVDKRFAMHFHGHNKALCKTLCVKVRYS